MSDKSASPGEAVAGAPSVVGAAPSYGRVHLGEVAFDDVFPFVTLEKTRREYTVGGQTYSVKLDSERYHLFKTVRACAACGLVGTKLLLDLSPDALSPHFNLYAVEAGALVLMTKDHIVPASLGGPDTLENFRTMCAPCNVGRGNDESLTLDQIRTRRGIAVAKPAQPVKRPPPAASAPAAPRPEPVTSSEFAWALVSVAYDVTSALTVGDSARARAALQKLVSLATATSSALDRETTQERAA